jgi:glycosyltransferase involved in cell wall biosynthesis
MTDRPLRLLIVTPRYDPFTGGVETHVREVARRVAALGADVTVLTTDPSRTMAANEERDGVRIHRVPAWPRGGDLYWAPGIRGFVRRGAWDVVHCQGIHSFVAPLAMLAAGRRIPFVVTFHTGGHSSTVRHRLRPLQWLVLVPLLRRAARLVAVSRFEADLFARLPGLGPDAIEVIPNGADPLPMPVPPPPVDPQLVLSIGRLERYKGHQRAIAALPELARSRPACPTGSRSAPWHRPIAKPWPACSPAPASSSS